MSAFMRFRVFVGNIPWTIGSPELKQFATKFGPVASGHVVFDKNTGLNKGYGFVNFNTQEAYESALKSNPGSNLLDGHTLTIHPSN